MSGHHPNVVAWPGSPRRTRPDFAVDEQGFPITTSTQPAPLEAAHAASEHTEADDFLADNRLEARARARLVAALTVVALLLLVAVLAKAGPL